MLEHAMREGFLSIGLGFSILSFILGYLWCHYIGRDINGR
jgi:hypothetical protein